VAASVGIASLLLVLLGPGVLGPAPEAAQDSHWFVAFERQQVAPVARNDTTDLFEVGTIDTDGFSDLVFSLGGEFKEVVPTSGTVGALLIPDIDMFQYVLRSEGQIVFPLEVKVEVGSSTGAIFISEQQRAKVAFPSYRIYMYNETTSGATVQLFIYRTR
jgi:hypothetical protein